MVILREKVRCRSSGKLLIRESAYDTERDRNVLSLHQIKTAKREMKIMRMVCLTNTTGDDDICSMNPESS